MRRVPAPGQLFRVSLVTQNGAWQDKARYPELACLLQDAHSTAIMAAQSKAAQCNGYLVGIDNKKAHSRASKAACGSKVFAAKQTSKLVPPWHRQVVHTGYV